MKSKQYIQETHSFLQKIEHTKVFKGFIQLYLVAFYNNYKCLNSWNVQTVDLTDLKQEAMQKISYDIFKDLEEDSTESVRIIDWLKKFPPLDSDKDILGDLYLLLSEQRKQLGEHYTRVDLVNYILDQMQGTKFEEISIIDPACGSGNFLVEILRRGICNCSSQRDKEQLVQKLYQREWIKGIDIQVIPSLITKAKIMMELIKSNINLNPNSDLPIYAQDALDDSLGLDDQYDLVITNPPFLRYQSIDSEKREYFKTRYKSARGHFDLYTVFVEKCIEIAKANGSVVILCSDKFMVASYGRGLRQFIKDHVSLLKVINLSEIYPFDAAVLSAVYFFENRPQADTIPDLEVLHCTKEGLESESVGYVEMADNWRYARNEVEKIIQKVSSLDGITKLGEICKVSIGIQTTADQVFCRNINDRFYENFNIEKELIYPFLRGKDLQKWSPGLPTSEMLYPYVLEEGETKRINLDDYPYTKEYLVANSKILEGRNYIKKSSKLWFEPLSPKSHKVLQSIKILTPDVSSECKFSIDLQGNFCNGTVYFIQFKEEKDLSEYKYLLAILNSRLIDFIHKKTNTVHLASKKYRFQTQHMKLYPIRFIARENDLYKRIVTVVDSILKNNGADIVELENTLNELVFLAYGLDEHEIDVIESFYN